MAEKMNGLYYSMRVRDSIDEVMEYGGILLSSANKKVSKAPKATSGFIAGPRVHIPRSAQYIALRSLDRRARLYPLQLHLLPEIARRCLNELLLGVPGTVAFLVLQEHYAAAYIARGDDRGLHQRIIGNALNGLQRLPSPAEKHLRFSI